MAYTCAYYQALRRPRAGADCQDGSRMPQAAPARRRYGVEAGCGWGAWRCTWPSSTGRGRAFNISASNSNSRARGKATGLEGQVEFIEDDYRNISGRYDVFASVACSSTWARALPGAGRVVRRSLTSQVGLIHSIGRNRPAPLHPWIERRIFPALTPLTRRDDADL